jgi:hypothetical protein
VDLTIKHITSTRALPISRGLHQRHVSRDSMKSAFAIPTTRTLLIWGRGGKSVSLLLGSHRLDAMLAALNFARMPKC